jgi:hypothetical protein
MRPDEIRRLINAAGKSILRPGTCDNDINRISMIHPFGWSEYGASLQNAAAQNMPYRAMMRKRFPRSEQELDAIMMRRVNARLQLQQDKIFRHWKHVAIGALVVVFAPLIVAAVLRLWGASLAWIAS